MCFIPVILISFVFLARSTLILIGWIKGPIIRSFEKYGDQEAPYLPLIPLLLWGGVFAMAVGSWGTGYLPLAFPLIALGFIAIIAALLAYENTPRVAHLHNRLIKTPYWYHALRERTTRYERRRIAYAWLRMPWRTRMAFNTNDHSFFIWADFVIMSTVMEEEDKFVKTYNIEDF
ncbi:MAG TPA: hypothetical protein VHO69_13610 [Phototrophicaceae bacterium]|nr:hypothetical protein [Phototrophicaceae bacterium]